MKKKKLLDNIPSDIDVIDQTLYISKKVRAIGFDWDDARQVFQKVEEEVEEIKEELNKNEKDKIKEEVGDLIFSLINFSSFLDFDIREALKITNKKFIDRFKYIEESLTNNNSDLKKATLEEMEKLWNKAKNKS